MSIFRKENLNVTGRPQPKNADWLSMRSNYISNLAAILIAFVFIPFASCHGEDFCSKGLLADAAVSAHYRGDKTIVDYLQLEFYMTQKPQVCTLEERGITKERILLDGFYPSYAYLTDADGVTCSCGDHSLNISYSKPDHSCTFMVRFDNNRYPIDFQGSCLENGEKQKTLEYDLLPPEKGGVAAVKIDGPLYLRTIIPRKN